MLVKMLRCKKIKSWLPDEYLTSIVGFCDRGRFTITKQFTLPCTMMNTGKLYIEGFEDDVLEPHDFDASMLRCANCGGEIEQVEVDSQKILDGLRSREVDMKRGAQSDRNPASE